MVSGHFPCKGTVLVCNYLTGPCRLPIQIEQHIAAVCGFTSDTDVIVLYIAMGGITWLWTRDFRSVARGIHVL